MVRPKQIDTEKIVQQSMLLFWTRGMQATSMRDVAQHCGVTTGALYNEYDNKQDLYLAALRYYLNAIIEPRIGQYLADTDRPALKNIERFLISSFDKIPQPFAKQACFLINSSLENEPTHELDKLIVHGFYLLEQGLLKQFKRAKALKQIEAKSNVKHLAMQARVFQTGLLITAKASDDHAALKQSVRLYIKQLQITKV